MKRPLEQEQEQDNPSFLTDDELDLTIIEACEKDIKKGTIGAQKQLCDKIPNIAMRYIQEMRLDVIMPHIQKHLEQHPQLKTILSVMCISMIDPTIELDDCAVGRNGEEVEKETLSGKWTNALYYLNQAKSLCENNIYTQSLSHIIPVLKDPDFRPEFHIIYKKSMIDSYKNWLKNAPHSALALSYVGAKISTLLNPSSLKLFEYVASLSNMELQDDDSLTEASAIKIEHGTYRQEKILPSNISNPANTASRISLTISSNGFCNEAFLGDNGFFYGSLQGIHYILQNSPNITKATITFDFLHFIHSVRSADPSAFVQGFIDTICYILADTNVMQAKFIIPSGTTLATDSTTSLESLIMDKIPLKKPLYISIGSEGVQAPTWFKTTKYELVTKVFTSFAMGESLWPCADLNTFHNFSILEHSIAKYNIYFGSRKVQDGDAEEIDMPTWYNNWVAEGSMLTISTFLPLNLPLEISLHVSKFLNQDETKDLISKFIDFYSKNPRALQALKEQGSQYNLL